MTDAWCAHCGRGDLITWVADGTLRWHCLWCRAAGDLVTSAP